MNGRDVGGWKDAVDPLVLRMELVALFTAAVIDGAIRPKLAARRSNRNHSER